MRAGLLLLVCLVGCGARRHMDLEFTAGDPTTQAQLGSIVRVDAQVWDRDQCACADLDTKTGCGPSDAVASLTFDPQHGDRGTTGFPDGSLTVRVTAYDTNGTPIGLRYACWCVPDRGDQALVFPLGQPTDPQGVGCK